jgi:hypothetical protein
MFAPVRDDFRQQERPCRPAAGEKLMSLGDGVIVAVPDLWRNLPFLRCPAFRSYVVDEWRD